MHWRPGELAHPAHMCALRCSALFGSGEPAAPRCVVVAQLVYLPQGRASAPVLGPAVISLQDAVTRLRRVPPRRLPVAVGRLAVRTARARARRWNLKRNRGELSEAE